MDVPVQLAQGSPWRWPSLSPTISKQRRAEVPSHQAEPGRGRQRPSEGGLEAQGDQASPSAGSQASTSHFAVCLSFEIGGSKRGWEWDGVVQGKGPI